AARAGYPRRRRRARHPPPGGPGRPVAAGGAQGGLARAARGAVPPGPGPARGPAARGRARAAAHDLLPDRLRLREALLGAALLLEALPGGLPEVRAVGRGPRTGRGRVPPPLRRDLVLAARAHAPRLPFPEPDVLSGRAVLDRLPGRAHGPAALRPGLAAARQLRGPRRGLRGRPRGGVPPARRSRRVARHVPAPVRADVHPAQPQGAGHVRIPGHREAESCVSAVHSSYARKRAAEPRAVSRVLGSTPRSGP